MFTLNVLDNIYADIQKLRGCSCSCSDGVIDDVEDILDKYRAEVKGRMEGKRMKENTAMIYINWSEHTNRETAYKVPYEIARAVDKLLEKNQVERDVEEYWERNVIR